MKRINPRDLEIRLESKMASPHVACSNPAKYLRKSSLGMF
jgi:hypothetical protein